LRVTASKLDIELEFFRTFFIGLVASLIPPSLQRPERVFLKPKSVTNDWLCNGLCDQYPLTRMLTCPFQMDGADHQPKHFSIHYFPARLLPIVPLLLTE
jgi:hypothetical protein